MEAKRPLGERSTADTDVRLLQALFEQLPAMVAYWDSQKRNVIANHAYVEWFGIGPDDMRGIHIREVLGEEVYAKNLPFIEGVLNGKEQLFDRTLVDTSGRTRHTHASYVPDVVEGQVRGFFVLVTDVTPRVEAQRAMDEAQSLAGVGSWEMVLETGEFRFSDELFRIFGVEQGAFVPTLDALIARVHPDDVDRVTETRARATREGGTYGMEYRIVRPDGSVREVRSRGRAVTDATGTVVRLAGSVQDVTESNAAARELARTNAELVQLNELSADVVGMLGHDVRGPLSVVLGYLEELDEDWGVSTEADRRSFIGSARGAAERLRTLVDDILALASVESGIINAERSDHDVQVIVAEAHGEVPGHAAVAVVSEPGLKVWCDAFHVRQIIANLTGNALRYGAPPVVIAMVPGDDTISILVSDEGPGVPEEFVPRLFDRFTRAAGQRSTRGTGLGLYIARRLAEANDGTLSHQRGAGGRGAVFTLTLPRVD